jgi:hypothetical protein
MKKEYISAIVLGSIFIIILLITLSDSYFETNDLLYKANEQAKFCYSIWGSTKNFLAKTRTTMPVWITFMVIGPVTAIITLITLCTVGKCCKVYDTYEHVGLVGDIPVSASVQRCHCNGTSVTLTVIISIIMWGCIFIIGYMAPTQIQCSAYSGYTNIDIDYLSKFGCIQCNVTTKDNSLCTYFAQDTPTRYDAPHIDCSDISNYFSIKTCDGLYSDLHDYDYDFTLFC